MPKREKEEEQVLGVTRSGTVITEKVAEEMAEELERNPPDLSTFRRHYLTRPLIGDDSGLPRLTFSLPQEEIDALLQRVEEEGRSIEDVLREALARYLNP